MATSDSGDRSGDRPEGTDPDDRPVGTESDPVATAPAADEAAVGDVVARLTDGDLPKSERRHLLRQLAGALGRRGFKNVFRPKAAMGWIADTVADVAPRIPLRSATALRDQFPGLHDDEIIERLVKGAARATAGIGVVGGGVAAIEWVATPTLLTAPALLAAETVAVVAVELKLIGELHELYGLPVPGSGVQRGAALVQAWAGKRGVNLMSPGAGITAALGIAARKEMRDRLLRRFGRNLTTLGPLMTGAAIAAFLNRRATLSLADEVRDDLRRQTRGKIVDS